MLKDFLTFQDYFNQHLNEADEEIPVDKALDAKTKKKLKDIFENTVTGVDSISFKKNGTILAKRGYFYRHGQTSDKVANELKAALSKNQVEIEIVDSYDDWKAWPKDSNFIVIFKITSI